jgi:NAD(P)-dependent dehydrogenase (short-subunit alcohol dehydrogenase family)
MAETTNTEQKTALVTGAGTGLGFATAKLLSENGWQVFGTIIPSQSPDELKELGITPIVMDITDRESVADGYEYVANKVGDKGLAALINVAGVAGIAGGVIEGVSEERIKALFDVNVFGTIRVIQVFLPLLREYGPARIVNVSSSGVRVPSAFSGIYAISKYAVEGITNSLRYEMPIFGIQVTSIEPGAMDTPMTANSKENMAKTWDMMPEAVRELYYEKLNPSLEYMDNMIQQANPPEVVAKVILKALNAKKMRIRYVGGKDVRFMPFLQRLLGENLFEKLMITIQKLPKPEWA